MPTVSYLGLSTVVRSKSDRLRTYHSTVLNTILNIIIGLLVGASSVNPLFRGPFIFAVERFLHFVTFIFSDSVLLYIKIILFSGAPERGKGRGAYSLKRTHFRVP